MPKIIPISERQLEKLDEFLCSDNVPEEAMDVSTLEGFLTAIVIGPQMLLPSQWLPWVWDLEDGQAQVEFESLEQAEWAMNNIMALMNNIADTFAKAPEDFEPIFWRRAEWGTAEWCEGFLLATEKFNADQWASLWTLDAVKGMNQEKISLITPFIRLGDDTGIAITIKEGSTQHWMEAVQPVLLEIHDFWQQQAKPDLEQMVDMADMTDMGGSLTGQSMRRDAPKIGRNKPCPCGSGKKYKKCCGGNPTIH